jgi:hypothetical protein
MELDEKYASVILRRYAEFKGNGGEDISCVRDGVVIPYSELVIEPDLPDVMPDAKRHGRNYHAGRV